MNSRLRRSGLIWLGQSLLLGIVASAMLFLLLPLAGLAWRNLQTHAWQMPLSARIPASVRFTLEMTAISLGFILVWGTPLAYALARWQFPGKRWMNILVDLPIVLPPAVAGLGLLMAFGRRGLLGPVLNELGIRLVFTPAAVVMAQIFVAMPFYVRAAQSGFRQVDPEIENAARVDGANALQRFVYVIFPITHRTLLSGALVSWARALGEFGATIFFAGNLLGRSQPMTVLIYTIFETDVEGATWAALILIGIAFGILTLVRGLADRDQADF
jgi:molybdate transport system permease protein